MNFLLKEKEAEKMLRKLMKKTKKKAISPVITTILLVLISITTIIIIAGIIVPFVKENLSKSKECFEVADQLIINTESGYTCYYDDAGSKIANLTIKRGEKEIEIEGFIIAVSGEGTSKSFEIKEGAISGVKMIDGSSNIVIPKKGEERTYSITTDLTAIEYAEIAPIMRSGRVCEVVDTAEIEKCI